MHRYPGGGRAVKADERHRSHFQRKGLCAEQVKWNEGSGCPEQADDDTFSGVNGQASRYRASAGSRASG